MRCLLTSRSSPIPFRTMAAWQTGVCRRRLALTSRWQQSQSPAPTAVCGQGVSQRGCWRHSARDGLGRDLERGGQA